MNNIRFEEGKILYKKVLKNMKYDLKQNIITCGLVPSLEHITLTKIAITFFQYDICDDAEQLFNSNNSIEHKEKNLHNLLNVVESKVLEKSSLIYPSYCRDSLKQIITIIKDEIEEFLSQNLDLSFLSVNKAKEIILIYYAHLCWTQEGKINIIKTIVNIIENSKLFTVEKYILACDNCLEDKIQSLLIMLPENFLTHLINADNKRNYNSRKLILLTFWTYHFRGEQEKFSQYINGEETYEYLLKWTIQNHKKIAWHYFWENFADDAMKAQNLFLVEYNEYISLTYLLTQMNHEEIENFFNVQAVGIFFENILDRISKSCKVKLVPYYILDYIKTHDIRDSYVIINYSWVHNHINTIEYEKIWEEFVPYINNDNITAFTERLHSYLFTSILFNRDWQTVKFLLKFSKYQNIKDFFYNNNLYFEFCIRLIIQGTDHFNKIIKLLLISEEEISKFKQRLFSDSRIEHMFCELITNDEFKILKIFSFVFCSKEEISNFKKELVFKNNASIILNLCKDYKGYNLLSLLNKFISWCYDENEEEVTRCKAIIFDLETQLYTEHKKIFFNNLKELIKMKKWDLVNKHLKWIFLATKDKIDSTEKKLERIKIIFNHVSCNTYGLLLKMFITSCFDRSENDELKEILTNNIILNEVQNLIYLDSYEEIYNLLDWRFSSDKKEIAIFKDLFMDIKGRQLLFEWIKNRFDISKVQALFKWFKPSLESSNIFKENFLNYFKNKRRLHILHIRRCKNRAKRCLRVWDLFSIRINKSLQLLSNYVEEINSIEKKGISINGDNIDKKDGKKRENEGILFEKRKKAKLF